MLFQVTFCLIVANFTFDRLSRKQTSLSESWSGIFMFSSTGCHNHQHRPEQRRSTHTRKRCRQVDV